VERADLRRDGQSGDKGDGGEGWWGWHRLISREAFSI